MDGKKFKAGDLIKILEVPYFRHKLSHGQIIPIDFVEADGKVIWIKESNQKFYINIEDEDRVFARIDGGVKFDDGKPRLDLIPSEALEELGKVLAYGANKYSAGNWANGIDYSRLIAAAMRHLAAFNSGVDIDPESGLCHVSHAMCNLAFLVWHQKNKPDRDDRWVKEVKP